ncbi:hypothetical protein GH733_000315, partial [Mirounga leonina]
MNQASTRSHCIFTIHLSSKEPGSATVRHAKLHLVDLAGSERVAKTGVGGQLLTEAKYINLSLHYLEQVIIALSEKHRAHIPYRNSMMTSVLRDSLGGNCMTTMIATLSLEKRNIDESISTCRFAQRVALIKNEAVLNEEIDPKLMIICLQKEIQELKDELALVTGERRTEVLTDAELLQWPIYYCSNTGNGNESRDSGLFYQGQHLSGPFIPAALWHIGGMCLRQSLGWRNRERLQVVDDIQDKLGTRQALKPAAVLSFACPLFPLKTARSTSTHRCSAPPPGLAAQAEIMESLEKMSS